MVIDKRLSTGSEWYVIQVPAGKEVALCETIRRAVASGSIEHKRNLQENGIPTDVLEALLPGDDIIELEEPVVSGGMVYRFAKRAFDVLSCGAALVVLSPVMLLCAARIKRESPGPVIYAQRRVGKGGRVFSIY